MKALIISLVLAGFVQAHANEAGIKVTVCHEGDTHITLITDYSRQTVVFGICEFTNCQDLSGMQTVTAILPVKGNKISYQPSQGPQSQLVVTYSDTNEITQVENLSPEGTAVDYLNNCVSN